MASSRVSSILFMVEFSKIIDTFFGCVDGVDIKSENALISQCAFV